MKLVAEDERNQAGLFDPGGADEAAMKLVAEDERNLNCANSAVAGEAMPQ